MLELKNIKKTYLSGENSVEALKGISISLRDSEFVSILGPSGCGKTTTLNIIGGLDRYTDGELTIDNKSTKTYKDKDWDEYRNHKVGFVFQSYNLIPHQTILSNVEIALTIANVSKEKREKLAKDALIKVGLEKEMKKFPRQLSGGQMQRVAIARAIVNNPTVLLADEPTGALDSKTSIQVMDILKELSKECLVVMVTHNEELAKTYSTRIVNLYDGEITGDSNPFNPTEEDLKNAETKELENKKQYLNKKGKEKKVGMPFITALKLSLSNLRSKIGRTLLTCFAGSIGIIGIALILSVSTGFNNYIDSVETSTLSQYPIEIDETTINVTSLLTSFMLQNEEETATKQEAGKIVPNYVMVDLLRNLASSSSFNDLKSFKTYLEQNYDQIKDNVIQVKYNYRVDLSVYDISKNEAGNDIGRRLKPFSIPKKYSAEDGGGDITFYGYVDTNTMEQYMGSVEIWSEMFDDEEMIKKQYKLLAGEYANDYDEVVLVLDKNGQLSDFVVYSLGIAEDAENYIRDLFKYVNGITDVDPKGNYQYEFSYDELIGTEFYVVPNSSYFVKDTVEDGSVQTFSSIKGDEEAIYNLIKNDEENVVKVKISGILIPDENSDTHSISGSVGYTKALTDKIIEINNNSDIVKTQIENEDYCLIDLEGQSVKGKTWDEIQNSLKMMQQVVGKSQIPDSLIDRFSKDSMLNSMLSEYFGQVDESKPTSILIYPKSFDDKDAINNFIQNYNASLSEEEKESKTISYNDYLSSIMGSVTTIVNAITYVLIAFVSISLIVSSIMIAIITYISVLERTKEIGILRAMGASKRDVKNIFNAETFITGFISGILGIVITIILNIPLSLIIEHLSGISKMAVLPIAGGISLVVISFLLSVFSGLIPSSYAAKCDPVIALRSE